MNMLSRFFKPNATDSAESAPPRAAPSPDPRGAPGSRIYHEIFIDDEPHNGAYPWSARAYAADGTPHAMSGSNETHQLAMSDAISWAESKKAELRGAP